MVRNFACVEATPAEDNAWRAEVLEYRWFSRSPHVIVEIAMWQNIYLDFKEDLLSSVGVFTM